MQMLLWSFDPEKCLKVHAIKIAFVLFIKTTICLSEVSCMYKLIYLCSVCSTSTFVSVAIILHSTIVLLLHYICKCIWHILNVHIILFLISGVWFLCIKNNLYSMLNPWISNKFWKQLKLKKKNILCVKYYYSDCAVVVVHKEAHV